MKKIRLLVTLIASSLLLASCDLPKNLEDILDWRGAFTVDLTPEQLHTYLGPILALVIAVVCARGLMGTIQDLENGTGVFEGHGIVALVIYLSIALIYLLIPTSDLITQKILPDNTTIDSVLKNLHLSISLDPIKNATGASAITVSILLPLLVSYSLVFDLILALSTLVISSIQYRIRIIWVILSIWTGHAFFISIFIFIEFLIDRLFPSWDYIHATAASSGFFVFIVLVLGGFCYFFLPLSSFFWGPEVVGPRSVPQKGETNVENHKKRIKIDLDDLTPAVAYIMGTESDSDPRNDNGEQPHGDKPSNGDNKPSGGGPISDMPISPIGGIDIISSDDAQTSIKHKSLNNIEDISNTTESNSFDEKPKNTIENINKNTSEDSSEKLFTGIKQSNTDMNTNTSSTSNSSGVKKGNGIPIEQIDQSGKEYINNPKIHEIKASNAISPSKKEKIASAAKKALNIVALVSVPELKTAKDIATVSLIVMEGVEQRKKQQKSKGIPGLDSERSKNENKENV